MKKEFLRNCALVILLIFINMLLPFIVMAGEPGIDIELSAGFQNKYKIGNKIPVKITVTNSGNDFSGEIQVQIVTSNYEYNKTHEIHAKSIELPQNSSVTEEMEISIFNIQDVLKAELVDKKGSVSAVKTVKIKALPEDGVFLGILSDSRDSLGYMRSFNFRYHDYTQYEQEIAFMEGNTFPKSYEAMSNFNLIVINDFDTRRLSAEQTRALSEWVRSGGILVLGTGENYEKVTGGLAEVFTKVGETFTVGTEGFLSHNTEFHKIGTGIVIIHTFDLGMEISDYENELNSIYHNLLYEEGYGRPVVKAESIQALEWIVNRLPSLNDWRIKNIIMLVYTYILFIGPVLYFILKKWDMREKGLVAIPVISVIITLAVYFLSLGAAYKNPIVNTITVTELNLNLSDNNNNLRTTAYSKIFSPYGGKISLDFSNGLSLGKSFSQQNYGYNSYGSDGKSRLTRKILHNDPAKIIAYDKEKWDGEYVGMNFDLEVLGNIDADIYIDGEEFKGAITNNTGMDFQNLLVSLGDINYTFKDFKNGQTIDASGGTKLDYYQNYNYFEYDNTRNKDSKIYNFNIDIRNNTLRELLNFKLGSGSGSAVSHSAFQIIAINSENILEEKGGVLVNKKNPIYIDNNFFIRTVEPNFQDKMVKTIPVGVIKPEIQGGNAYIENGIIYNMMDNVVTIGFKVPKGFEPSAAEIYVDEPNGFGFEIYHGGEWKPAKAETYEEGKSKFVLGPDNFGEYIDKDSYIRLRVTGTTIDSMTEPKIMFMKE